MIHIEDLKRIDFTKMDGLEKTAPVHMASKASGFPEHVYRLLTDVEREKRFKLNARRAMVAGVILFWGLMALMVWAWLR